MSESTGNRDRKNPKSVRGERFVWKEGDLEITYDPYAEKQKDRKRDPSQSDDEDSGNDSL